MPGGVTIDGQVSVLNPETGEAWLVPQARAQQAVNDGFVLESRDAFLARKASEDYDSPIDAAGAGAWRTATLGLSDVAHEAIDPGAIEAYKRQNPIATTVGEVGGALMPYGGVGLAGRAAGRLGGALGRVATGAAEGGAMGLSQGVSRVATSDDPASVIAEQAVIGAVTGGLFSVVGLGLGALGRKIAGRAQGSAGAEMRALDKMRKDLVDDLGALNKIDDVGFQEARAGLQAARAAFEAAEVAGSPAAQRVIVDGVERMGAAEVAYKAAEGRLYREAIRVGLPAGRASRSGVAVAEIDGALARVEGALEQAQKKAFGIGGLGQILQRLGFRGMGGGLGGVAGYGLGGFAGGGIGLVVGAAALPWAGRQLARVLSNKTATKAIGSVLGMAGKGAALTTTALLTRGEVKSLREQVAGIDPAQVREAAHQAYSAEGIEPDDVSLLADFQGRRAAALKAIVQAKTPRAVTAGLAAVQDPRGVLRRLARNESTPQDRQVLRITSPGLYRQITEAAKIALEEDGGRLSSARRRTLQMWAGEPRHARAVLASQENYARQAAEREQQKRNIRGRVDMLPHGSQLQAMEAGGGPGLR